MVREDTTRDGRERINNRMFRRDVLKAGGTATGAAMLGLGSAQAHNHENKGNDTHGNIETTNVTVSEGTNVVPTVSPDGKSLVIGLQGILFHLPREGGHAEPLTDIELEAVRPDYGPDGNRITFFAYANGNYDIWTMASDGSDLEQLTDGWWDDREPKWSPNGHQIAFSSDRGGGYDIWTINVNTGNLQQWTNNDAENYAPTWSPDGTEIAYVTSPGRYTDPDAYVEKIKAVDKNGNKRTVITAETGDSLRSPSWSPDGEDIAYVRTHNLVRWELGPKGPVDLMVSGEKVTDGEDVFVFPPNWLSSDKILYSADGKIRTLELESGASSDIPFSATFQVPKSDYKPKTYNFDDGTEQEVQGIDTPVLSPNGKHVAFVALNDLWVMRIGQSPHRITDDSFYQSDPAWSPDGRYLAYSSDQAGTPDLYVHDMHTETDRQVTSLNEDAAVSAAWSPDGTKIAFKNQNNDTLTVELETGEVSAVGNKTSSSGRPTWSADGNTLAMPALKTYSDRFREGTIQILTVDVETGEEQYHPPGDEFKSISTFDNAGPVWSPDGRWMAFVVESTLRVMPVNESGKPTGPAKQITNEATDHPTWSGDSEWLLYLNNGILKKIRRDGSETQEVTFQLNYSRDVPTDRKLIHVGRMWDGTTSEVKNDVTIEIDNNRIKDITTDSEPPSESYVDASELTVIPGLWDTHTHSAAQTYGIRQGRINLAYGITSIESMGDADYHAVNYSEALKSDNLVGPRFFKTGEILTGSRTSGGRTVTSMEQMSLELSRARELDYDFVKTYVRMGAKKMAKAANVAHELGVPIGTHLFSPGVFVGEGGTTHLRGTQRLSWSWTDSQEYRTYDDVVRIHGEKESWVMTTLFSSDDFLLANDVLGDSRTQLFPPWKRTELRDTVADNAAFPSNSNCDTRACRRVKTFKRIFEHGGTVLTGTDASGWDYYGLGVHTNLRALERYAFSPYEALLTATRLPAEQHGVEEDLGTIESGKLADMVFIEGNPLEQIEDAMQVKMTMKNGELFAIEDLVEPLTEKDHNENATYYQVDFVKGEPIKNLDWPDGTYTNDQLIRFAHGSTDEAIIRRSDGEFTTDEVLAERIDSQDIRVKNGTATITFTVADGESVTLTLASYTKPDPTWDPEDEDDQVFVDAETNTFESGTHTLTVDLPDEETDTENRM